MALVEWNTDSNAVSKVSRSDAITLANARAVCGDVQNVIDANATLMSEGDCNMACSGNDSYICGGSSRISYYTWTGTPLSSWDFPTGIAAGEYQFLIGGKWNDLVEEAMLTIHRRYHPSRFSARRQW
jgi:hypothetical protein